MVCEREIRGEGRWRAGPGKMLGRGEAVCWVLPHLRRGRLTFGWTGGVARRASLPPPATALQPSRAAERGVRCGLSRGVVGSGVQPHAGGVRERFGWKAKVTEVRRTRPPLAGRRGIGGPSGGLLARPRRVTGNHACARNGRRGVRALCCLARRCGVGSATARRRRARTLWLESQSYGDDGCGYVVGSCAQRRRGWKAAETQRLESRCHYPSSSCSICLRTSGGSAARERGDFFRRGVEVGRPRWCLDAAQRAMARASATSGGLGVDSRRK